MLINVEKWNLNYPFFRINDIMMLISQYFLRYNRCLDFRSHDQRMGGVGCLPRLQIVVSI